MTDASSLLYRDIHAPVDLLPQIAAARAAKGRHKHLILLTSNWAQYDLTVNLIASLAAVQLHNYWLLVDNAALVAHAGRRKAIAASWSSLLERFARSPNATQVPECACFGLGNFRSSTPPGVEAAPPCLPVPPSDAARRGCLPSVAAFYKADAVRRLWLLRFHYAGRLVALGYSVLLLDSDSLVFANPFPLIAAHLGSLNAIGLEDVSAWPQLGLNGGTWYFRARPHGPVHSALRAVGRRARRVLEAYPEARFYDQAARLKARVTPRPADFLLFDQTLINLAFVEQLAGTRFELNSTDQHSLLRHGSPEAKRVEWIRTCCHPAPSSLGHPPWRSQAVSPSSGDGNDGGSSSSSSSGAALMSQRWPASMAALPSMQREARQHYGGATTLRLLKLPAGERVARGRQAGHGVSRRIEAESTGDEWLAKAPEWLFAAESDASATVGRTHSTMWGALPPPAAIVHFVCSSWPGSDGRRAAMRAWGHWHAEEVTAEMDAKTRQALAARVRGFVSYRGPVHAASPKELEPFLRLLTLVALATRRTPVLPWMRCDLPGQRWVDERVDVRTGGASAAFVAEDAARRSSAADSTTTLKVSPQRPCGWAMHRVGQEALSEPLCIQRPLEGCFHAFATPDEIAPYVPPGFWNDSINVAATAGGTRAGIRTGTGALPSLRLFRRTPPRSSLLSQALEAAERTWEPLTTTDVAAKAKPFVLPDWTGWDWTAGASASQAPAFPAPLLLLEVPGRGALRAQPLVEDLRHFSAALKALSGMDQLGSARGLGTAWSRCLKMVRNNKCTSVC